MNADSDALKSLISKIDPKQDDPKPSKPTVNNGVLFQSNLSRKLDSQTVQNICDSTIAELSKLELDLGRNITAQSGDIYGDGAWWSNMVAETSDGIQPHRTFMGKRQLFEMTYRNRVDWRKYILGGLFTESNRTMPIAAQGCRHNIARAIKAFFSVDPWVKATATNKPNGARSDIDTDVAIAGERFFNFKAKEAALKGVLTRAIEKAYIVGECVLKTRHSKKQTFYSTDLSVLVNAEGKFVLGSDGDYIVEGKDSFAPKTQPVTIQNEQGEPIPSENGEQVEEPVNDGVLYLERDGETAIPPGSRFEFREDLVRLHSDYDGPVTEIVPTQDFLCSQTEESIHTAPMIANIVSVTPYEIVQNFGQNEMENLSTQEKLDSTANFIKLLTDMESDGSSPKTAGQMGRPELNEEGLYQLAGNTRSEFAEVYRNYDADGDGSPEEIFMVIDRKRKTIVFMDYLQNVSTDGKRPFSIITVSRVDGRWHGEGMMEQIEHLQTSIDIFYNRACFSTSSTGTTTFFRSEDVTEGDAYSRGGMPLPFNCGNVYHPKTGKDPREILTYVTIPNEKMQEFMELMSLNSQMASNSAGVMSTNDMQAAGLDSSKTATGVRDNASKGEDMFFLRASHIEVGLESTVQQFAHILFERMAEQEEFEWTEGDERLTDILRKTDANRMKYFFSITMVGGKNEQITAAVNASLPGVMQWAQQPSVMMEAMLPMVEMNLRALQIVGAGEILRNMLAAKQTMEAQAAEAAQMQAQSPQVK